VTLVATALSIALSAVAYGKARSCSGHWRVEVTFLMPATVLTVALIVLLVVATRRGAARPVLVLIGVCLACGTLAAVVAWAAYFDRYGHCAS
jgi:hypothetical protein